MAGSRRARPPLMVAPTPPQSIPPFLRAVVILRPGGNVAAEVVAAVARRARPRWAVVLRRAAIPFVVVAGVGAAAGIWRSSERRRACGEASRLGREGALQQEAGDFAAAWDRYADALELCPGSDELAFRRLANAWRP